MGKKRIDEEEDEEEDELEDEEEEEEDEPDEEDEEDEGWATCPECDKEIKEHNLRKHLQKVHRMTKREALRVIEDIESGGKGASANWGAIAGSIFVVIIIIVGGWYYYDNYYQKEEKKPEVYLNKTYHDLGTIAPGNHSTKFVISNDGNKVLIISHVVTNCDCTSAKFVWGGKESPIFKQSGNPTWEGEFEPHETGDIIVNYDTEMFQNRGPVTRTITFNTNDEDKEHVILTITANVVE